MLPQSRLHYADFGIVQTTFKAHFTELFLLTILYTELNFPRPSIETKFQFSAIGIYFIGSDPEGDLTMNDYRHPKYLYKTVTKNDVKSAVIFCNKKHRTGFFNSTRCFSYLIFSLFICYFPKKRTKIHFAIFQAK